MYSLLCVDETIDMFIQIINVHLILEKRIELELDVCFVYFKKIAVITNLVCYVSCKSNILVL